MSNFSYQSELQKLIEGRQLVEAYLRGEPTYKVAQLLRSDDEFLTFAEVSSSGTFSGIIICRMQDINSISFGAVYLAELKKQIQNNLLHEQISETVENISEFTFDGFFASLESTDTIVEVNFEDSDWIAGRIVGYDNEVLAVDEYSAGRPEPLARTYFNRSTIVRIALGAPQLRTISQFLSSL